MIKFYLVLLFTVVAGETLGLLSSSGRRPSVLFVISDDLRYDSVFAQNATGPDTNQIKLPNIRRLLRTALSFENAVSNFASCGPSRQSFLTGRSPDALGVWNQLDNFRQRGSASRTLPEHLMSEGYTTISIGKVFHNDPYFGIDEAYSWSETYLGESLAVDPRCPSGGYFCACVEPECADFRIASKAVGLLPRLADDHFAGTPFFLAVGFRRPHLDWRIPDGWLDRQAIRLDLQLNSTARPFPSRAPNISYFSCDTLNERGEVRTSGQAPLSITRPLTIDLTTRIRNAYWASVAYMDEQLGKIIDSLEQTGLRQETIVIFTGDHGFSLGERSFWCKQTVQDVALRVPLLFSLPWLPKLQGVRSREPAELLDLYPTIAGLLNIPLPDRCLNGRDLAAIIESDVPDMVSIKDFSLSSYPRCISSNSSTTSAVPCSSVGSENIRFMAYSIRTRAYRYTQWRQWIPQLQIADWSNAGLAAVELYDHRNNTGQADPALFENENLAGVYRFSMVEVSLQNQLETVVKSIGYSNRRCGQTSPTPAISAPTRNICASVTTEAACDGLFASRCAWFLGYGCQDSLFCGFKTKERVRISQPSDSSPFNLPDGAPGCSLFSSRCAWRANHCEKLKI